MVLVDFAPFLPEFFSLGLVGVGLVSWLGDDGSEEVEQEGDAGEDFDMGDDDDFGMDDFDDDFGGMDGMDDGGGNASSTELENRIEDLESEIANVSSTANTVRSENEQISEKVDDVEENVRKLLEIYEMVTRGVNPFVDDVGAEAGIGGGGADFGLFGEEEESTEDTDEDLGSDIADAEAEEFFEDDAFEDDFGDDDAFDPDEDSLDDEFGDGEMADEFGGIDEESPDEDELLDDGATAMTDSSGESTGGSDGGTSFEELKAEYESGEADWAEDESLDEPETEEDELGVEADSPEPEDQPDLFHQDDLEDASGSTTESATVEGTAEPEMAEEPTEATNESAADSVGPAGSAVGDETTSAESDQDATATEDPDAGFQFGAATATESAAQPHLADPPNGYLSDVLIMEWLDFLVSEFDARNAIRAINHYERIDWIGESMRDHCYEVLQGITDGDYPYRDESGPTDLTMADHRRSLRYIENLATGHLDAELGDRLAPLNTNGVQR